MTISADRPGRAADLTRDRSTLRNQVLLGGVVLLAVLLVVILDAPADATLLMIGTAIAFAATGAAFVVPWNRLPAGWELLLPLVDILAIGLMRQAAPTASLGLLWAFPAMWVGSAFGAIGTAAVILVITGIYWVQTGLIAAQPVTPAALLLPVVIAGLSMTAYLGSRRSVAQRIVLDKQSRYLQQSVDRARRQEDLVTDVLDAVDFGVLRLTTDGALVVTNEAHARLQRSNAPSSRPYAADGATPLDPDDLPLARARRGDLFENELVWYGDPGDERRRALRSTARRIVDTDLSDAGTIIVTRDVTTEELALRAREDLVASVSHELRTPLTSITGYVELALDDPQLPAGARRSLEVAERNATRLLELVSDILTASALSRKGAELSIDPQLCDLAPVVDAAIEATLPRAVERRMTIDRSDVEESLTYADPHRIRQVIDNLLSNAVKYGNDGGHVWVTATSDGLHTWIVVRDDGPGVSQRELPRLFDRFFRSSSVRNSTTHGSGLGLAISRDIVRAHSGEITVQTAPGEGTTFVVRLPATDPGGEN